AVSPQSEAGVDDDQEIKGDEGTFNTACVRHEERCQPQVRANLEVKLPGRTPAGPPQPEVGGSQNYGRDVEKRDKRNGTETRRKRLQEVRQIQAKDHRHGPGDNHPENLALDVVLPLGMVQLRNS